jgi:hypothetical protein
LDLLAWWALDVTGGRSRVDGSATFRWLISPRWIRRVVLAVCALAIAAMIATSITNHVGAAIAAGSAAAVAILCLILVTAVAGPEAFGGQRAVDEAAAADLERRVEVLVANGADEGEVRSLIRAARRIARRGD